MSGAIDWTAVQMEMMRLEGVHGDDHAPVGEVIARMLGMAHSEEFDEALATEIKRAAKLGFNWYEKLGVQPTLPNVLAVGFMQGITFVLAVEAVVTREVEG